MTTTISIPDDATLVQAVADGDEAALEAIYDRYAGRLLAFCLSALAGGPNSAAEAEDCLHDVFVVAATRLGQLRDPTQLRGWLFAVARHECLDRLSPRKVSVGAFPDAADPAALFDAPVADATFDTELARRLDDASEGLSGRDRVLLELADRQELSGEELALAVGAPRSSVDPLVARARGAARASIGAILVARTSRPLCGELDRLLGGWDGQPATLRRKQVNRHIEGCETCSRQRERVATPLALLGEGRAFAAEMVGLRTRILAAATVASASGVAAGEGTWTGGWPPRDLELIGAIERPKRRWGAPLAALMVLLLAIGATIGLLAGGGGGHPAAQPGILGSSSPGSSIAATGLPPAVSPSSGIDATGTSNDPAQLASALPPSSAARAASAPSAAVAPKSPSPSPSPKSGPWTVLIDTNTAIVVRTSDGRQAICGSPSTSGESAASCQSTVPDGTQLTIAAIGQLVRFSAPPSCAGLRGSCTFTVSSNLAIEVTTLRIGIPRPPVR